VATSYTQLYVWDFKCVYLSLLFLPHYYIVENQDHFPVQFVPGTRCMPSGKSFNLSEAQCPDPQNLMSPLTAENTVKN
jgi:hypothetical protein